jgi:hypothetical protein
MLDADEIRERIRKRLAAQQRLVRSLLALREQLQGSLFARYGTCGKETCVCRHGQKHGPYYVLSTRGRGQGAFAYLQGGQLAAARSLVLRYRAFRRGLRRLKKVNLELVGLLQRYQGAMARAGGKRLGMSSEKRLIS